MASEPELENYEDVLFQVSNKLSSGDAQKIAIQNRLEQRFQEGDADQFVILVQLLRRQLISEAKPQQLAKILRRIDRHDLSKESERLSATLKKISKKKQKVKQPSTTQPKPRDEVVNETAPFVIARSQIDQLAISLENLPLGSSRLEALEKLNAINKCLSRAERDNSLPLTDYLVKSVLNFSDDDSSISSFSSGSCQSSLSSVAVTAHMVVGEEERNEPPLYEAMNYGELKTEEPSRQRAEQIDFRPPHPAPRPAVIKPRQTMERETVQLLPHPTIAGAHHHRIPLPGMIHGGHINTVVVGNDCTGDNTGDDDNTEDSGHGTGSGFSNVEPFLKEPLTPKRPNRTTGHPPSVPPKPLRYTPLVNPSTTNHEGYTQLRQMTINPLLQQYITDTQKQ